MKQSIQLLTLFVCILVGTGSAFSQDAPPPTVDHSGDRMISMATAISEKGGFSGAAHLHSFFGFAYSIGAMARYTKPIAKEISLGIGSNVGVLMSPVANVTPFFYGAGPMVSFGDQKLSITVGGYVYGSTIRDKSYWLVLPSVGVSGRMNDTVRFNAEVVIPVTERNYDKVSNGVMMYGFRFGKRFYGGVDFILPFGGESTKVYEIFPIGIPILSVGYGF